MAPDELNLTALILPYAGPFISSVLIFLIGYIITEWNKIKDSRKKRAVWIGVLESNKNVEECLRDFEKIKNPNVEPFLNGIGYMVTIPLIIVTIQLPPLLSVSH